MGYRRPSRCLASILQVPVHFLPSPLLVLIIDIVPAITARDLLQANATIIAGVLILLTITASFDNPFTFWEVILVSIGTLPFVFSCVFLLEEHWSKEYGFKAAKRTTYFGLFVYSNNLLLRF